MALESLRPDEPLVDPRTGLPTKRFLGIIREINSLLGGLTFADIGGAITLGQLVAHTATHQLGGSDAIKLDDLATPDDTTDLDATILEHGLLPKLSGNPAHRLNGMGLWV